MGTFRDLTGEQFGKLKVLKRAPNRLKKNGRGRTYWVCQCSCENHTIVEVEACNLTSGRSLSCGCERNKKASKRMTKHSMYKSPIYTAYTNMKARCLNPNGSEYKAYGGRGINICEEWLGEEGFENFLRWSLNHGYKKGLSIDRIDNDKNYSPDNCRWVDRIVQANNKQNTLYFDIGNGPEPFADLCRRYGVDRVKTWKRIQRGWSIQNALKK